MFPAVKFALAFFHYHTSREVPSCISSRTSLIALFLSIDGRLCQLDGAWFLNT
jgi:hypothetical protein